MSGTGFWVELHAAERRLGGGFLLTRRHVLTAFHCLRGSVAQGEPVDVVLADGTRLAGRVSRCDPSADLALVTVLDPHRGSVRIPAAGTARSGDAWHGPYRPARTEAQLLGTVDHPALDYESASGEQIQAIQLRTHPDGLGDYSGYSGGPVVKGAPDDPAPEILGILLEQLPDRFTPGRAAGVLFAATIAEAFRRFDVLEVEYLMDRLRPADPLSGDHERAADRTPRAARVLVGQVLVMIDAWAGRASVDASLVSELKFDIEKAVERQLGGDPV
ncbi:serine protease [Streptomyces canus]|uniref:S1 family peptidase n=1 Tax=Streptomyces canus TaxID=58343 RepID=UPI0033BD92F8